VEKMNVVEFKGANNQDNLLELLGEARELIEAEGYDQGIIIMFDRSGKNAQYLMSHRNSIAAVGWLEVLKQINIDEVMS
jgi:hypothetical protein